MSITDNEAMGKDLPVVSGHERVPRGAAFATAIEAARFLRLSKPMIHKMIGQGKIPACRYGRAVRVPWRWLEAQERE
jgi:excisionase family DNA binding protein